jgi:hypothetical protein
MLNAPPLDPSAAADHQHWSRDDLLLIQRKVLREWSESDWLAANAPRAYEEVRAQDGDLVRVDMGGGVGEAMQQPGMIVVGQDRGYPPPGQNRFPDLFWLNPPRLPFDDGTIDELWIPDGVMVHPEDIGRVLRLAGRVRTSGPTPGNVGPDGGLWYVCTQRTDRIERTGPANIKEVVLGVPRRVER